MKKYAVLMAVTACICLGCADLAAQAEGRRTICLDGTWEIAEGKMEVVPKVFDRTVPVPGLADMADPPFESPGGAVSLDDRRKPWLRPRDPRREAFWYRRTFKIDGPVPAVALLKIHKAKYGKKVYLNGQAVGEHFPCFTPGYFDVKPHLKGAGQTNELMVRVGASLSSLPRSIPDGWDNEKSRYIPGIYDRVELVLSGTPHVVNVQTVPDVPGRSVRVVAEVANAGPAAGVRLQCRIREWKSGTPVGERSSEAVQVEANGSHTFDLTIPIENCRLWRPEDPFLYTVEVSTGADVHTTRFGMRSFSTDPKKGVVLLNGKPYYLRGSNVCIFRFFEDAERGALPWDEAWVRKLHRRFKDMHWNSLRYCIGFPPEKWYEIADEEGILIQDEFPIWYSRAKNGWPESIKPGEVIAEYTEWMRERWNHPCVVIWDAQNETKNDKVTAAAIRAVRGLDLSGRPWENGWGSPQAATDVSEYHPYRAYKRAFTLSIFERESGIPNNGPRQGGHPPYIINEYGWLWINRDGSLPTLTRDIYKNALGEDAPVEQCRLYYARMLAGMTEFWRARRKCAGVLHFCGLGYSRPNGQTSDNFIDVGKLEYDPFFYKYVRDAFAPVGVMVDFWKDELPAGAGTMDVPVVVTNDPDKPWRGKVALKLVSDDRTVWEGGRDVTIEPLGTRTLRFKVDAPRAPGKYQLVAELHKVSDEVIRSLRDFRVPMPGRAQGKPVTASSVVTTADGTFPAEHAVDGRMDTRWSSEFSDPQWIQVDLGRGTLIRRVVLHWERAAARAYAVKVSDDGKQWKTVHRTNRGNGGVDNIRFKPVRVRYLRIDCTKRTTKYGYSLWEIQVH